MQFRLSGGNRLSVFENEVLRNIQGVNKIMETLRNWGIEFVCVGYTERTSVGNIECSSVRLHSVVLVSVHRWLCWVIVHVKESENGRLVRFWKRSDRWCAFSWSICDKNCHIIGCIESDSFQGYVGIHESWEDNNSEEEQWAKINVDRKGLSYIEKNCFEKSQNYCSTGDRTAELNIHREDPLSTKTVRHELHKSKTFTEGLQLLNLWLLKVMLYWWEIQKERDHWEDQDVGGWTILKLILER
jgi:hypothetical protein